MHHCDVVPTVLQWSSEPFQIPYRDPITGKQKVYVPDFFITKLEKGHPVQELIEIKPIHEQLQEHARNSRDAMLQARNTAKWGAAIEWCARHGASFVVHNETDLYSGHEGKLIPKNPALQYAPGISRTQKQKPRRRIRPTLSVLAKKVAMARRKARGGRSAKSPLVAKSARVRKA